MKKLIFGLLIFIPAILLDKVGFSTNPYVEQVIVQQKVVQFNPDYYLGVQGYFAHGENLKQKNQANIAAENDALLAELQAQNKLLKDILAGLTGKKIETPATPPIPEPVDTTPDADKKVLSIFSANCAKCHGDTKSDGGLTLVKGGKLVDVSLAQAVLVHHRTNAVSLDTDEAAMPKGTPALSDDDVDTIRLWMVKKAKDSFKK